MKDESMFGLDSKEFLLEENEGLRKMVVELRQERDDLQNHKAVLCAENERLSTENQDLKRDIDGLSRKLRYASGKNQDSVRYKRVLS